MTGPQGGSWVPLGALKSMPERAARGVDEGKARIGFANSSTTVDGIAGRAPQSQGGDARVPGGQPLPAALPGGGLGR
jgi:hypothetical protein